VSWVLPPGERRVPHPAAAVGPFREGAAGCDGGAEWEDEQRCAVISLENRAAQNDHDSIARASKSLLGRIDED
jgi:hypothetical protein